MTLCPTCNRPPSDPVVRPHAVFCRDCFASICGPGLARHDASLLRDPAPGRPPRPAPAALPEPREWRPIPGFANLDVADNLSVRSWRTPGKAGRRAASPRPLAASASSFGLPAYLLRGPDRRQVWVRGPDLYRLAFGRDWPGPPGRDPS